MAVSKVARAGDIKDQLTDEYDHTNLISLIDDELTTYIIDGHTVVKDNKTGEFIDYVLMSDQYFYENWVTQFAIGNVGGKNYFNVNGWSDLTNQLTKGVMVVHEETKELLFIIPKLIEPYYSKEAKGVVNRLCKIANNAQFQTDTRQQNATISALAKHLNEIAEHDIPNTGLTGLIPPAIYTFYDINPKAMKAVIYIRDHYGNIHDDDTFNMLSRIMKRYFDGRGVTLAEKALISKLSNDEFIFDDEQETPNSDTTKKEVSDKYKREFSPFED